MGATGGNNKCSGRIGRGADGTTGNSGGAGWAGGAGGAEESKSGARSIAIEKSGVIDLMYSYTKVYSF